jgi:hypothetical protein
MGKKDLQGPCLSPWSHGLLNLKDEVIQFHIPPMLLVALKIMGECLLNLNS